MCVDDDRDGVLLKLFDDVIEFIEFQKLDNSIVLSHNNPK